MKMFCCGWTEKQYYLQIFQPGGLEASFWCKKKKQNELKPIKHDKEDIHHLSKSATRLPNKLSQQLDKTKLLVKTDSQEDRDICAFQQEIFSSVTPIEGITISASEISKVLLESPQLTQSNAMYGRMIQKSNYQLLMRQYPSRKELWVDKDFPRSECFQIGGQKVKVSWISLDILSKQNGKRVKLLDKFIQPKDIIQSEFIGDCYFMSAISALASHPRRILRLFPTLTVESDVFMTRLMFKGILQEVVVDQFFPYDIVSQKLLSCRPSKTQNEIYAMLLEKCWAKLWKSYPQIDSGYPHEALRALTGAPTKNYFLHDEAGEKSKSDSFFQQILRYHKSRFVICTGTNRKGSVVINHRERGVITVEVEAGHIYTVEQVREEFGQKQVKIYNPWGHNIIAETTTRITGELIIKWADFVKEFYYLTVCKVQDHANYLYMELQGCKKDSLRFIDLQVRSQHPTTYALALSETDHKEKRELKNQQYICVTIMVLRELEDQQYSFVTMKTTKKYSDHYLQLINMPSGKLLVCLYFSEVNIKETLTFSVYSEGRFGFKEHKAKPKVEQHFFSQMLLNYNFMKPSPLKYPNPLNDKIKVTFRMMVEGTILGYYLITVQKDSPQSFIVKMGREQFKSKGFIALPPYDKDLIQVRADPGHDTIVVFMITDFQHYQALDANYYFDNQQHIHENMIFQQAYIQKK